MRIRPSWSLSLSLSSLFTLAPLPVPGELVAVVRILLAFAALTSIEFGTVSALVDDDGVRTARLAFATLAAAEFVAVSGIRFAFAALATSKFVAVGVSGRWGGVGSERHGAKAQSGQKSGGDLHLDGPEARSND